MKRFLVLAVGLALALSSWAQEAPQEPNPLAGLIVEIELPPGALIVFDDAARWAWSGPATLYINDRAAALIPLEDAEAPLPRRRWGAGDWIVAGLIGAAAAIAGYSIGRALP